MNQAVSHVARTFFIQNSQNEQMFESSEKKILLVKEAVEAYFPGRFDNESSNLLSEVRSRCSQVVC